MAATGLKFFPSSSEMTGIYLLINSATDKVYVGSSVDIRQRWMEHTSALNREIHKNKYLQNAWNKHADIFEFVVVEECSPEKLLEIEQLWLDATKDFNYNLSPIAGNTLGKIQSEETKLKISKSRKGQKLNFSDSYRKELIKRGTNALKIVNEKGLARTPEARAKLSAKLIDNQRNRKSNKWPHELGVKCPCRECKDKRNVLYHGI